MSPNTILLMTNHNNTSIPSSSDGVKNALAESSSSSYCAARDSHDEEASTLTLVMEAQGLATFRVGIFTTSVDKIGSHVYAISNAASPCIVTAICTLDDDDDDDSMMTINQVEEWCRTNKLCCRDNNKNNTLLVSRGYKGFAKVLSCANVDAIYLALPYEQRNEFVCQALDAGKHVMVDYPIATSVKETVSLFDKAKSSNLVLFESTKFIHHHRVTEFLQILETKPIQGISSISTSLNVREQFLDQNVLLSNPYWSQQGCISTLARYCVFFGVLTFHRVDCKPIAVTVRKVKHDGPDKMPTEAHAKVKFDNGCSLYVDCSYIHNISVRQHVEVNAQTRSVSMINFVFPHHSLASYLLYELDKQGKNVQITQGECVHLAGGPPGAVMLWRKFAELSQALQSPCSNTPTTTTDGNSDRRRYVKEVQELAYIEVESHNIVLALMKSIEQGCVEVILDPIDYPESWQ